MTEEEMAVLRRFAQYMTTDGKLRYSEMWDAYVLVGETVVLQEELDLLYKIAE